MKPARFSYHAPTSLPEAVEILAAHGDEARPLAGGQSLVPMLALRLARFEHLVDLNRIPDLVGVGDTASEVVVGAMTRQAEVGRNPTVRAAAPLVTRATGLIGHFQIRNRGTIGGSLAHADPASEYEAVLLALDGQLDVVGPSGDRTVAAGDFFVGTWTTCLQPGELLRGVRFPRMTGRSGFDIREVARRHGDFAIAGVAVALALDDRDRVARAGIGLFGMGPTAVRAVAAEDALTGRVAGELGSEARREVAQLAVDATDPSDDIHAGAVYRRQVGVHLTAAALADALQEATGA